MAVSSHHDVVTQSLSTDAPSSVDVSASNTTSLAARAADIDASTSSRDEQQPSVADPSQTASDGQGHITQNTGPDIQVADSGNEAALADDNKRSLAGDGSVGSDTDTSKTDAGPGAKDIDGGLSRNTIKKPATFKPVSVTKSFLAKAGSAAAPAKAASGSEKSATPAGSPGPNSQSSTPRPRLVAKSIGGQKGVLPKTASASSRTGPNGPDASQVWNKNRAQITAATPKHLTDEELRQQYGIQLASRPLDDGNSNEAKWADIDDEDDDWAPETIEWNDGTKTNLAETATNTAAETSNPPSEKAKEESEPEQAQPKTPQAKTTSIGPNPTVLKLGGQQRPILSASKASDKPTLVAKPSSHSQAKSPWAPLPAVDKVSPVQVNPPVPHHQPRFGNRDPHGFDAMPPAAKEIEADDFSRFRDMPNGNPRELYMPNSGRYEPVNDARRPSIRKEGNFRQPAVLQRPSVTEREQVGPAEPSPAFQTHRTHQDGPSWAHRRGSSSASMEQGRFARRVSIGRAHDPRGSMDSQPRRSSQFRSRDASPSHSHVISVTSQSPTASAAAEPIATMDSGPVPDPQNAAGPPEQTMEDAVAMQKRLMREKREAAIKRREEEEARQEAEKRERIRQKMEKLGMRTDNKPETKAAKSEHKTSEPNDSGVPASNPATKENRDSRSMLPESPPKPPIPSPSGEPQQYGLMKVHAPQPAPLASPRGSMQARPPGPSPISQDPKSTSRVEPKPPLANGDAGASAADILSPKSESLSKEPGPEARLWSSMQSQASGQFQNWSASTMAVHSPQSGSLWGPPSNHRALGNGDFQSNVQRTSLKAPQQPYAAQGASTPQPIGTPRNLSQSQQSRSAASSSKADLLAGTIIEDLQTVPAFPSEPESRPRGPRARSDGAPDARSPASHHHHPKGAPAGAPVHQAQPIEPPHTGRAAWANFSQSVEDHEAAQAVEEHAARMAERQLGLAKPQPLPTLNETWKQVKRGEGQGTRHVVGSQHVINNYQPTTNAPQAVDFNKTIAPPAGTPQTRSRYQDIFDHQHRSATSTPPVLRPVSPSMSPTDSPDSFLFDTNKRPVVKLPPSKAEKPVVKLPPPKQTPSPPPRQGNARQMSYSNIVKSTSATNWQNRFDNLFDRESKVPSPPVLSATKPHFDLAPASNVTAVSLPSLSDDWKNLPKNVEEEEALFEEERAFGSTPTIRVPPKAAVEVWSMAPWPDYKKVPPRALKDDGIFTVRHLPLIPGEEVHGHSSLAILLPGMAKPVFKPFHRKSHGGTQRGQKASRGTKRGHGPKSRNVSGAELRHAPAETAAGGAPPGTPTSAPPKGKSGFGGRHGGSNRRPSGVASGAAMS